MLQFVEKEVHSVKAMFAEKEAAMQAEVGQPHRISDDVPTRVHTRLS